MRRGDYNAVREFEPGYLTRGVELTEPSAHDATGSAAYLAAQVKSRYIHP